MKQNTKFLWIYIAILFSFALILIVFAGLTQNNYKKEIEQQQTESAGVKQSLITLTDENQKMTDTVKSQSNEIAHLKKENTALSSQNEVMIKSLGGDEAVTRLLLEAYSVYQTGDTAAAAEKLKSVDKAELTEGQRNIYNTVIGE